MKLNRKKWTLNKRYNWIFKFSMLIFLVGLFFRLFFYQSSRFDPQLKPPFVVDKTALRNPPLSAQPPPPPLNVEPFSSHDVANKDEILRKDDVSEESSGVVADDVIKEPPIGAPQPIASEEEKCDLFTGDWIPNPSGPMYTNASCTLIEGHQNCLRNGRPDTGYLFWRWNPRNCELPLFDARRFLELMRDKTWALIGDSISRNHVQSLLCMLSTVERAVEVYHDEEYKSKRWHFTSYNLTISNIWSPFLVKAAIFEDNNGVSSSEVQLQLDKLDKNWTDQFPSFDYAIISTGEWYLKAAVYHENDTAVGCHICPKGRNLTEDINTRSFENGEWHNGGGCPRLSPVREGEIKIKDINRILLDVELAEFKNASAKAAANGVNLRLLDFTKLLLSRPDGHPGPYRQFQPFAENKNVTIPNDCLHWCLPGPMDNLNDIIMEVAVNG